MFKLLGKGAIVGLLLTLLASNLLTLTSAAYNAALSGALTTALGVRTVTGALDAKLQSRDAALARQQATTLQRRAAARRFGNALVARSQRVAARSIAAIPMESLPYIGVAAIVAGTAYELYAMCQTLEDLDQLYSELGIASDVPPDTMESICARASQLSSSTWQELP